MISLAKTKFKHKNHNKKLYFLEAVNNFVISSLWQADISFCQNELKYFSKVWSLSTDTDVYLNKFINQSNEMFTFNVVIICFSTVGYKILTSQSKLFLD